ncbi:MAG: C40 family peptidase [Muribaculaceae bacterium]|nr:C40 family peptidase [Muribaculaceae bacterium]
MKIKSILVATMLMAMTAASAANNTAALLDELKKELAPDGRTAVWDVSAATQKGVLTIYGTVGTQELKDAVTSELNSRGVTNFKNQLIVLENGVDQEHRWGQVKLSIATLRCKPSHSAEIATQGIMGAPVKVLEYGDWCRVVMPDDYIAYVPESSLAFKTEEQLKTWREAKRYIVTVYDTRLVADPKSDVTVTDLVLGNILEYVSKDGKWICLATPDGRTGWVERSQVAEFSEWAKQDFDVNVIESTARRMMGSSYLWGGTSTKVTDCSGLVKVSYFANGIILQRDASQQALTGKKFSDWHEAVAGDLLFFGNSKTGRVTHVGIYLRDGKYIHCSGQVKINSLEPDAPDYLYSPLSLSRIDGEVGTRGIIAVRDHKWYF